MPVGQFAPTPLGQNFQPPAIVSPRQTARDMRIQASHSNSHIEALLKDEVVLEKTYSNITLEKFLFHKKKKF
mgnify:FL=1